MQIVHYDLTLNAAVQNLVTALGLNAVTDLPFKQLTFMLDEAAAGSAYIGARGDALSSTVYGVRLDPTNTGDLAKHTFGPFPAGSVKLGDFAVLGGNNEILHILGVVA